MNTVSGNKTTGIVAALVVMVLFGLAGCAGAPEVRVGTNPSHVGYGTGVMPTDNPANSG